ncbi:Rv3235 family protein [Ornithinimicrobium faecis]|uniref:Rv3235 family protein n=1 Tax=Ornithinimicrobium faecis TaxID=2934158 RepID=A0ABY4YPL2_9MICO|nr:Rv3235 family protein [Ornithinimicrobium sp. HY1793]USQ78712.1 Rv3235 family protein [Ornithinimicrobium sp. HY1793]
MSAQPLEHAAAPADGQEAAAPRRRSALAPSRARGGHLRVLPIPDNEPPPLPRGMHPDAPDPRFVQGCLAVDFQLEGHDELFGPQSTGRADLPDPEAWAQRLITAILEAMDGVRPAGQLSRWISPDIRDRITRRGILARQRHQRPGGAHRVRALRVCEPADGIAEVAAVISHQTRVRALALRMTGVDGRWLITALELG